MTRNLLFFFGLMALVFFTACHGEKNAPASEGVVPQEAAGPTAAELNAEIIKKNNENVDRELLQGVIDKEGLPPIGSSHMEIVSTNERIGYEDAERSYLFRKSAIEHCYVIALARDESVKGYAILGLKRDAGTEKAVLDRLETDIKTEKFEECLRNSVDRWPLPEGAQMTVKIRFSSKPAPSVEELQKQVHEHEDAHAHH